MNMELNHPKTHYQLIADSGSTKTDWCVTLGGRPIQQVRTKGLNPFQLSEEEMADEMCRALRPALQTAGADNAPIDVYFYGAGCSICGHEAGIACILGTGSNSCAFDGERITHNVSPLGFILGDEGSGAVLGRTLVGDILKRQLPQPIIDRFERQYRLTAADIIDRVYRQKLPNRFLASFAPFLAENIGEPAIHELVTESFRRFLRRNVMQYAGWQQLPIGFNGSIATVFRQQLQEVVEAEGMHLGRIIQAPMEGLVEYHAARQA